MDFVFWYQSFNLHNDDIYNQDWIFMNLFQDFEHLLEIMWYHNW
jgi:hypothetical protein